MTTPTGAYGSAHEPARITASRSESRKRSVLVGLRLTPEEHADLIALAERSGRSAPDVLRAGLLLLTATEVAR